MDLSKPTHSNDLLLWHTLVEREWAFINARVKFLAECKDRVGLLRKELQLPSERGSTYSALHIMPYLTTQERQELFDELLALASVANSDIELCREIILSLPRTWVIDNIEERTEPFLKSGTYDEYRRFLELYRVLDRGLTHRLATRAAQNTDEDIREAGQDFLEWLEENR